MTLPPNVSTVRRIGTVQAWRPGGMCRAGTSSTYVPLLSLERGRVV